MAKISSKIENRILKQTEKKLSQRIEELSALYEVGKSIISIDDLAQVLNLIIAKSTLTLKANCGAIRLLTRSKNQLILRASSGIKKTSILAKKNLRLQKSSDPKQSFYLQKPLIINNLKQNANELYRKLAKYENLNSLITYPLIEKNKPLGIISVYSKKVYGFSEDDVRLFALFANQTVIVLENARLLEQTQVSYLNAIKTLASVIDAKDNSTYGHSERVMKTTLKIADKLGMSNEDEQILRYASFLHDIGKIGIDISILRKRSKLNKKDWAEIIQHPKLGAEIVEGVDFLGKMAPIILHHHERYSGGGYPNPDLKGEKIPIGARILAVADAYESMRSNRPYRKSLSKKEALERLKQSAGNQFDPKIVNILIKILSSNKKKR